MCSYLYRIPQGDISLDELRTAMLSDLSEEELSSAVEVYRHAYGDTISEAEAFEEMCCDALGKINIFAGTEHDSANYGKVQESFRKHTAERTGSKGRAPPKKGGEKYSREYENANVNLDIITLANAVKSGEYDSNSFIELGTITKPIAQKIAKVIGIDFTGYKLKLEARQVRHIFAGHGENGTADHSMSNVRNLAKMQFAIEEATNVSYAGKTNAYTVYENGKSRPADTVIYEKDIGSKSYYVVQTAVDTKKKTLYIVTAFIGEKGYKNGDTLSFDDKIPEATPKSATASSPNTNISNTSKNVNEKFSREVKNAEEYFGTTYKVKEAGYICTDGKMLDFSGRHEGAPGGYRTVDHRDITDALGEDYGGEDYSGGMIKFMSEGNIRVSPESGGINLSVAPNKAQRSTLDRYISSFRGEVILDIDRTNGDTIASVEYPKYTHSSVVFKDIDDYFDKGKIPEKFSREPVSDSAYMKAVERGDTESAQRMVDEAAKKAGYTVKMYHGSKRGGGFTVFRDWSYFTKSKKYAQRYTERGNDKSLYSAYVKIGNAFDTRKAADRYLFDEIRQEYGMGEIQDTGLPDWTDGYDIADYIDENGLNYDAIILDEGGDLVNGKPISRGLSYVIRNSNNIKSAEPITYDNNGNVIPLSERFKDNNHDIRYSREPERLNELRRQNERKLAQATAEDAANENERGLIRDYQKQYSKVEDIREKLSTARQEVLTAERSGGGNTTAKKKIKKTPDTLSGVWQGKKASNPRPTVLETAALPIELYPYIYIQRRRPEHLVGLQGLEPGTIRL